MTGADQHAPDALVPAPPVLVSHPWRPGAALALAALMLAVNSIASLGVSAVLAGDANDTTTSLLVGACLSAGYLITMSVVWLGAASNGTGFARSIALRRPRGSSIAVWVGMALGGALVARVLALVYGVIIAASRVKLPGMESDPLALFPGGWVSALVMLVVVVIFAPFAEEVVFRGVLLPALGAQWGNVVAVAVSAAVFALSHVNAFVFIPILFASLIFGWLFVRFESLWPAFVCHASFNAVAAVLTLVLGRGGAL